MDGETTETAVMQEPEALIEPVDGEVIESEPEDSFQPGQPPSDPTELIKTTFATLAGIANLHVQMRRYLSYRACGFGVRESCELVGCGESSVRRWRMENEGFKALDTDDIGKLVDEFGHKYLELEFLRNYRLFLRKDYDIVMKSISTPNSLSKDENAYLLKARGQYTPDQMAIVRRMVESGGLGELDFTQLVLNFGKPQSVTASRLQISKGNGQT